MSITVHHPCSSSTLQRANNICGYYWLVGCNSAKLSKYRSQLYEATAGGKKGTGEGFDVMKSGDARVAMIGFPSVGKSTLLSTITPTQSAMASYEFTTLTCIPGMLSSLLPPDDDHQSLLMHVNNIGVIDYKDAKIQLLDLPGIIEGASKGRGRGKQVIGVARTSDMVLMMLEAEKADIQRELLTYVHIYDIPIQQSIGYEHYLVI